MAWLLSVSLVLADDSPPAIRAKLDPGVQGDEDAMLPLFVWMSDQMFRRGGDYQAFTRDHENDKRSDLREFVLRSLREKARQSWERIAAEVEKLTRTIHERREWLFRDGEWGPKTGRNR